MSRALLVLASQAIRDKAKAWIDGAKPMSRVEFKGPRRTLPQNSRQWAMLTDIATQQTWEGRRLVTEKWKLLFLDALNREADLVPSLDGEGWVNIGNSSSDLSVEEHSDFMELMAAWGARNGVVFSEPDKDGGALAAPLEDAG